MLCGFFTITLYHKNGCVLDFFGMQPFLLSLFLQRSFIWEPLKTGVKSKNGQGVPASRKADEVRLYALRGGLTTKMVRTAHFRSHKVFRGDHI